MPDVIQLGTPGFSMSPEDVRKYIETDPQFEGKTRAEKADAALRILGLKGTRQKYDTEAEKKAARAAARKARKERNREKLEDLGLAPQPKGPKMSKEEKKAKRRVRAGSRREFLRQQALLYPDMARQFGLDPDRIAMLVGKTKPKAAPKPKKAAKPKATKAKKAKK